MISSSPNIKRSASPSNSEASPPIQSPPPILLNQHVQSPPLILLPKDIQSSPPIRLPKDVQSPASSELSIVRYLTLNIKEFVDIHVFLDAR